MTPPYSLASALHVKRNTKPAGRENTCGRILVPRNRCRPRNDSLIVSSGPTTLRSAKTRTFDRMSNIDVTAPGFVLRLDGEEIAAFHVEHLVVPDDGGYAGIPGAPLAIHGDQSGSNRSRCSFMSCRMPSV